MEYTLPLVGHSLAIFIVSAVTVGLAIIAVALRCFVRLYILRAFGWDDALMVAALVIFIVLSLVDALYRRLTNCRRCSYH